MVNYSDIAALRGSNEFIRVELSEYKVDGENGVEVHQGVDYRVNKGYVANAMVVGALGLGHPVLAAFGATPFSVFCAQSLLLGFMVGCLAKRAAANGRLKQVEDAYIREHGTPNEIDQSNQFHSSTTRVQSIKRFVLGGGGQFYRWGGVHGSGQWSIQYGEHRFVGVGWCLSIRRSGCSRGG